MAVRQATLRIRSLDAFLDTWRGSLSQGNVYLPPGTVDGEAAGDLKLDLVMPLFGRVGPIPTQVVHRAPDGGLGLQIPNMPAGVRRRAEALIAFVDEVRDWLLATGALVDPSSVPAAAPAPEPGREPAPTEPVQGVQEPRPAPAASGASRGFALPAGLDQRAPDRRGSLADRSLRDAMVELAVQRTTGVLTVVTADGKRKFGFWHKGGPVGWRSDPVDRDEVLGVLLYRAGHVTREQLAESLQLMETTGSRQGEAFMEMGVFNFAQLVLLLQKQTEFVLQRVMRMRRGVWAFHEVDSLPERFVTPPLKVPSLLFRALRDHARSLPGGRLQASLRPHLDSFMHIKKEAMPVVEEIAFSKAERKFIGILRSSSWRLREVYSVSNLSRAMTAAVIWALDELHFLEYREQEDAGRYLARVSGRVLGKAKRVGKENLFDVLEIHWICVTEEVEQAYAKLVKEFDPSAYQRLTPELEKAIEVVRGRLEGAWRTLRDDRQRRAYREEVIEASTIAQSAELLARKGEMAIMKRDRREAITCWSKAVELVPRSAEYREGYQRARAVA